MKSIYKIIFLFILINSSFISFASNSFNVNNIALPIATISGTTTVCQNASQPIITFTGSGGTAPYTFTYTVTGITENQTITTTFGNNVTIPVPTTTAGVFTYNLISFHDSASPTFEQTSTGVATVTISSPADIDFTFNNDSTCSGTTIQFLSSITGTESYTYAWDFGDGTTSNQQNPSHSFTSLGCSSVTFNTTLTVTGGGCAITKTKVITVKQKPDINFSDAKKPFDPFNNCDKASTNSVYLVTVGNSSTSTCISSFSINWGDGNTQNNISFPISHTYSSIGAYPMTITAIGSNGCANSKTYMIKNVSNPLGGLNSPGSTQNLCSPTENLQFSISNWGSNSLDTTYKINYGDGSPTVILTQNQLNSSTYYNSSDPSNSTSYPIPHIYTTSSCPLSSFQVKLDITNACGTTPFSLGNISILSKPTTNFTVPTNGCVNSSILFNNSTISGYSQNCVQGSIYTWDFGDGTPIVTTQISSPQNINHTYTNSGTYTATLTAQNGCGISSKTQQICIEPPLIPQFTLNNTLGCTPMAVTATNTTVTTNSCTPPTYLWSVVFAPSSCGTTITKIPIQTTTNASYNFTEPGTYTIKLTATNSCGSFSISQTVTVKKPPTVSINPVASICQTLSTTSINPAANVTNCGTQAFTYAWSFPGGMPATSTSAIPGAISYTTSGTYTISLAVTNECGTTTATNQTFAINPSPTITGTLFSCVGFTSQLTGSATPAITNPWTSSNPSVATVNPTGLVTGISGGTTTITYTNSNNCKTTGLFTVNSAPTITQPVSSTICLGGTPNVLSVTVSGTTGTPTYQWYSNTLNNTTSGTVISGETNNTYTPPSTTIGTLYYYCIITLTSGGCSSIKSNAAAVNVQPNITITTQPTPTQNLCVGATISTPLSIIIGETGNINYQWYSNTTNSNTGGTLISGANSDSFIPTIFTSPGNYYYYATASLNGNGCLPVTTNTAEIIIYSDPTISSQPIISQTLCQNATPLNLDVTATGGNGVFSYQWYRNLSNSNTGGTLITGATNSSYTPPTNTFGTNYYYCIITQNSTSGCSVISATAKIVIITAPTITQPASSIICLGQTPALLSITVSGAAGTPQYQWYSNTVNDSSNGTVIFGATNNTFNAPATIAGTTYYYCIINLPSGGCSNLTSSIAEVTINKTPVISNKTNIICSGNTFIISPINSGSETVPVGTLYTWSNPIISPTNTIIGASVQATEQFEISQTLINTTTKPATVTYTVSPVSGICQGNNFTIVVTVNPAISPNVTKSNSSCFSANNGAIQTNITGGIPFSSGSPYQVSWTGPNGFTSSASSISNLSAGDYNLTITDAGDCPIVKTFTITEPNEIIISTNLEKNISCFNASDGEIKINITGGTLNYKIAWTKNGIAYATTEDLSNLSPGTYVVTVSDANNCGPKTASFTIIEPSILVVSLTSITDVVCFGDATGAVNVSIIGGTAPYTFAWSGPNAFTSSNQNLNAIFAGTYTLIVTDNSGCSKNLSVPITQNPKIIINATTTPIVCYGDNNASINIVVSGGVTPYTIAWSNLGTGTSQNNLSAGDYTITVTDALNCKKKLSVNIPEAPIFTVNPVVKNSSCFGAQNGSITLNFLGGIAPVKLTWSDGSTAGTTRNNLGPGFYTVTIVDSKPCTITRTFTILEPQPLVLSANLTHALDCNNANSGAINLLVSGGSAPFTYSWSNGATTEDLNNIPAGNYLVTVTDSNGCNKLAQYSINRPPPIITNVETKTDFNCETKYVKQTFVAQVSGGVPPYQLVWSSGTVSGTNNEFMNTNQNGTAILYVTDAIGCKSNYSFNVNNPILGTPSFNVSSYAFSTLGVYSINDPVQFNNTATGNYISMIWDFGDGSVSSELNPVHTFINPKEYVVTQTVTYPFGCIYVQKINFIVEKGYVLVVPNAFSPNNDRLNDTFRPVTKALKNVRLDIYDTWGSMIYSETGDILRGWDGKIKGVSAENGNYYCKVSGETFYGTIALVNQPFVLIK